MYKSRLQELCHQKPWSLPTYTSSKDGPDHCPTFNATVSVNGIDFHSPCSAKSSKEAQNAAAKVAFNHFTKPHPLPSSPLSLPGSSSGIIDSSNTANETRTSEVSNQGKLANSDVHRSELNSRTQYMYKNQLQVLMQKKNLSLPVYGSIREGPPHIPRFKATVTVDGQTFESPDFFTTLREAEHAAAKVALASLSDGSQEVDAGVYKNLLQELSQKEGFSLPVYNTVTSGPPHLPTFVCTVEIEGETFSGKPAKSKKQAENFAAKVAWCYHEERKLSQMSATSSQDQESNGLSCLLQSAVAGDLCKSGSPIVNSIQSNSPIISSTDKVHDTIGALSRVSGNLSTLAALEKESVAPSVHSESLQNHKFIDEILHGVSASIKPSNNRPSTSTSQLMSPPKTQIEAVPKTEELSFSAGPLPRHKESGTACSSAQDPLPTKTLFLEDGKSLADLECSKWSAAAELSSGTKSSTSSSGVIGNRIQVYPRGAKMQPPKGTIWLPISDDEWVAAQLSCAKNQS